jgi:hypothetical protein
LPRPFDFYGVHFDVIFPDINDSSIFVTVGDFTLIDGARGVFGIGPFVPDSGTTFLLLGMGTLIVIGCRSWRACKSSSQKEHGRVAISRPPPFHHLAPAFARSSGLIPGPVSPARV